MERWKNLVAVVTGASSGIGEAIAKELATAGLRVVGLALEQERLDKNCSKYPTEIQERFFPRQCNVSKKEEVKEAFEWVEENLGGTDILVNNAGINRIGNLVDMDSAVVDEVIGTNIQGVIYCTQAAFKSMKAKGGNGHIIHINSIAGHKVPFMGPKMSLNVYPATKHAITAMNEAIRLELNDLGTKIRTTSVSPGFVKTEILSEEEMKAFGNSLNPEDIAQTVLFAISRPPHVQIQEITVKPLGELH